MQEGGFIACFPLNVLMVHSLRLTIITDDNHQADVGFTLGETSHFGSLKFIADRFCNLSLSPEGNDSGAAFIGMAHSGSPSLHTIFKESTDQDDTTSSGGGNSSFPISRGCNMLTLTIPITTTLPPKGTLAHLAIPMIPLRIAALQPDTRLLPDQQQAYQEERQG
jgi:hypothetical protein